MNFTSKSLLNRWGTPALTNSTVRNYRAVRRKATHVASYQLDHNTAYPYYNGRQFMGFSFFNRYGSDSGCAGACKQGQTCHDFWGSTYVCGGKVFGCVGGKYCNSCCYILKGAVGDYCEYDNEC